MVCVWLDLCLERPVSLPGDEEEDEIVFTHHVQLAWVFRAYQHYDAGLSAPRPQANQNEILPYPCIG